VFLQNTVLIASRRKKYNQQKWLNWEVKPKAIQRVSAKGN
jgi:hypothetical protein